jgi:peptidoglycan/xylan/chitin deacetylase (PgdA/CDA1 family)
MSTRLIALGGRANVQPDGVRDFVGYGSTPPKVRWPNGERVCLAIAVNYEEGAEYSLLEGGRRETAGEVPSTVPTDRRDLYNEMQYEYGSRVGVWRLLGILADHDVAATFQICGQAAERNPEAARAIVEAGHEPCGHGYRWQETYSLTEDEEFDDIQRCVSAIEATTGRRPVGWLSRSASVNTRRLIVKEGGFLYDLAGYNDELPYYVTVGNRPWLVQPYSLELNDMRLWRGGLDLIGFEDALIGAYDRLYREGADAPKVMSVGFHCRIAGTAHRSRALDRFLSHVRQRSGAWITTREELARFWLDRFPPIMSRTE